VSYYVSFFKIEYFQTKRDYLIKMSFGNDVDETTETKRKHAHNERVMNDPDSIIERGLRKEEQSSTLPWSSEEDRLLAQLQGKHGNKWALVAASLTKRTGQQCAQRWRHRVNPSIKREKWSKDEDEKVRFKARFFYARVRVRARSMFLKETAQVVAVDVETRESARAREFFCLF
jgi:hypothetical protein